MLHNLVLESQTVHIFLQHPQLTSTVISILYVKTPKKQSCGFPRHSWHELH